MPRYSKKTLIFYETVLLLLLLLFSWPVLISTHKGKEEIPVRTSHDLQWKKEKKLQVKED